MTNVSPGVRRLVTTSRVSRIHSWQQCPRHRYPVMWHLWSNAHAQSEKCASDSIGWSCAPCSMIVKKGEKNSMQKSIWVTVLQYIRLNRVSVAHQPGKWVILKSAMSGLNINVSHKSSWMLSSSRLKNSNHLMMTLVFPRNIKLLSFGNSASC